MHSAVGAVFSRPVKKPAAPKKKAARKEKQLSVRLEPELVERLNLLTERAGGLAKRAALIRLAVIAGLPIIEERFATLSDAPSDSPKKRAR